MAAPPEESYQCALHALLQLKNARSKEFQERIVKSFYGVQGGPKGTNGEALPAQVCVFSADQDPRGASQAPLLSIDLQTSQVCVLRPKSSSPRAKKSSHNVQAASSSFCINTNDGLCYEFRASDEAECQLWVNMLKFMVVFPFSSMPPEPQCNLSLFNRAQDPKLYKADCAWPVFIGHEEVGLRLNITGLKVLTLKGKIAYSSQLAKLEVYNFSGQNAPVLSCQHDRIRCTGKLGKYVYIEVGSRCKGGPGLLWMFCGSQEKANRIRDALYIFLLKQQVGISSQPLSPSNLASPTSPFEVPQPSLHSPRRAGHFSPFPVSRHVRAQHSRRCSSPSALSSSPDLSTSPNAAWLDPPLESQDMLAPPLPPRRFNSDPRLNVVHRHSYDLLQHPKNEDCYDKLEPLKLLSPRPYGYEVLEQPSSPSSRPQEQPSFTARPHEQPSPTARVSQDRYEVMESTKSEANSQRYEFSPQPQQTHNYEILESLRTSHTRTDKALSNHGSENQPNEKEIPPQEATYSTGQSPEQASQRHSPPPIPLPSHRKQRHTTTAPTQRRFVPVVPPKGERVRLAVTQRERHHRFQFSPPQEKGHAPQRFHWHTPATAQQQAGGYNVPPLGTKYSEIPPISVNREEGQSAKTEATPQTRPTQKQKHYYHILEAPTVLSNVQEPDVEFEDD